MISTELFSPSPSLVLFFFFFVPISHTLAAGTTEWMNEWEKQRLFSLNQLEQAIGRDVCRSRAWKLKNWKEFIYKEPEVDY